MDEYHEASQHQNTHDHGLSFQDYIRVFGGLDYRIARYVDSEYRVFAMHYYDSGIWGRVTRDSREDGIVAGGYLVSRSPFAT